MGQALFCTLGGRCGHGMGFTQGGVGSASRPDLHLLSAELLGAAKRLNVNYQDADG